jgi:hypothetical protein
MTFAWHNGTTIINLPGANDDDGDEDDDDDSSFQLSGLVEADFDDDLSNSASRIDRAPAVGVDDKPTMSPTMKIRWLKNKKRPNTMKTWLKKRPTM